MDWVRLSDTLHSICISNILRVRTNSYIMPTVVVVGGLGARLPHISSCIPIWSRISSKGGSREAGGGRSRTRSCRKGTLSEFGFLLFPSLDSSLFWCWTVPAAVLLGCCAAAVVPGAVCSWLPDARPSVRVLLVL